MGHDRPVVNTDRNVGMRIIRWWQIIQATIPQPNLPAIRAELHALKQALMDDQIDEPAYAGRRLALEECGPWRRADRNARSGYRASYAGRFP
jgi:hypothetical protein